MEEALKQPCTNCGSTARNVRGNYLFRESGLNNVVLKNIEIVKCDECGNEDPIIRKLNDVMRVLALAVIEKPYPLVGEEIRYLRKYLGMGQDAFAALLKSEKAVLSRWENNREAAGARSDLLIRAIALTLGSGLKPKVEQGIRNFPQIEDEQKTVRFEVDTEELTFEYA